MKFIVDHREEFGVELRDHLKNLLSDGTVEDLRHEMAIVKDVVCEIVKLCYQQEGDGPLLCSTTYDHWEGVKNTMFKMSSINTTTAVLQNLLPSVSANCDALAVDNAQREAFLRRVKMICL